MNIEDVCGLNYRVVTEKDKIQEILRLFSSYLNNLETVSNRKMFAEKFVANGKFFVLTKDECPKGFIAFYANDTISSVAFISMIAVVPEFRRLSLGSILLEKCYEYSVTCGMKFIRLEVAKNNFVARSFYLKNGFNFERECSTHSDFYIRKLI